MLPRPSAIIFDWDGTIVDTMPLINEATNHARAAFGMAPHSLEFTIQDSVNTGEAIFRRDWGDDHWQDARTLFLDHFLARHLARFGTAAERAGDPTRSFMAGAHELLAWLRARADIPCALLTNRTRTSAGPEIDYLGYGELFRAVLCAGEIAESKPYPQAAWHLLRQLDIQPGPHVWLVGDTHGDIACGNAAGLSTILIGPDGYPAGQPQPALHLPDAHALLALLQSLY